jgi:hypothetical protein
MDFGEVVFDFLYRLLLGRPGEETWQEADQVPDQKVPDGYTPVDMKTLVVGQKVTMRSGPLSQEVVIDRITEEYVRVRYDDGTRDGDVMGFRHDGTQCRWEDYWEWEKDARPYHTAYGPWRLELPEG